MDDIPVDELEVLEVTEEDRPTPEEAPEPAQPESSASEEAAHGEAPDAEGDAADADADGGDEASAEESSADELSAAEAEEAAAEAAGPGPGADLSDEQLVERAAALLFASPDPLSVGRLVGLLERPPAARVRAALEALGHQLEASPLPVQLRALKGGYTLMTVPELGKTVGRLAKGSAIERISPAALETLAIVAYRQPVTKAEIEAIRGVQAGPILRSLVDRGLAKVTGRADVPGHPLQYGTTKEFLDRFGLMNLDELPRDVELAKD